VLLPWHQGVYPYHHPYLLESPPTPTISGDPSSFAHVDAPPEGSGAESDHEDMHDYGGVGDGFNPPSPHGHSPPHGSPPSPVRHWPADFPAWLSSTSSEPPSSPKERLSTPLPSHQDIPLSPGTPPRSPLPVTRSPPPIPRPQPPILPLLQRKQPRNPPAADWRENQYKVKNAEQFRDKPKRIRSATPSESGPSTLPRSPSPSSSPHYPPRSLPLPPQLSTPVEITLSPPPGTTPVLPSEPSSPAIWQHREPTPAISSDDDEDSPAQVTSPEEDKEDQDEDEEDSSDPNDDTYDPAADDTFYSTAYAHLASIAEPRTFKESQRYSESGQ